MKQLNTIKEMLVSLVEGQMSNLSSVDTKEMGEAIDMIKDLAEAEYYCTITEAMNEKEKDEPKYYPVTTSYRNADRDSSTSYRDMDRSNGKMYFDEYRYPEREVPFDMRDYREGRSGRSRKMYMESKEMHQDKGVQLKELEKYMNELSSDITELIGDATAEEKALMEKKISSLASKISALHA